MKKFTLRQFIFMALCCDLGLFSKKLIGPVANVITESLHIPGGIATGFSIMFIVIATMLCEKFGAATLMCVIQSGVALSLGMVGSMGMLAPIGYIMPGIAIDVVFLICRKLNVDAVIKVPIANAVASVMAAFTANVIVFHLWGAVLGLYLSVAALSGIIYGVVAYIISTRLIKVLHLQDVKIKKEIELSKEESKEIN